MSEYDGTPILENEHGHPVIFNPHWVACVKPATDKDGHVIVGMTDILTALPPPNVPGVASISIRIKGEWKDIAFKLGLIPKQFSPLGDTLSSTNPHSK